MFTPSLSATFSARPGVNDISTVPLSYFVDKIVCSVDVESLAMVKTEPAVMRWTSSANPSTAIDVAPAR